MSNPVIKRLDDYENGGYEIIDEKSIMTVSGTMNAFFVLCILALLPALITWNWVGLGFTDRAQFMMILGVILGFIFCLIMCFRPKTSPYLAPLYAISEGMFLGGISAMFQMVYNGIVTQAIAVTFAVVFAMFALYKTGLIKVNEQFRFIVGTLTLSIAGIYLLSIITSLFGYNAISNFLWSSSPLSIAVSVGICIVAALNLSLDFDSIEYFSQNRAPSYMNWYCAMGLMVTIVWLYMEILRLLSKSRK